MISHTFIGVNDFDRAVSFYTAVMDALGLQLRFHEKDTQWAAWIGADSPRPLFIIGRPYDDAPAHPGNGNMLALLAASVEVVDQTYAQAIASGGTCEGAPGRRPHYHAGYYGAYFRDTEGNKIGVCFHGDVSA